MSDWLFNTLIGIGWAVVILLGWIVELAIRGMF